MPTGLPAIDDVHDVRSPERIAYGFGARDELTDIVEDEGVESALVVTDGDLADAGVPDPVVTILEDAGVEVSMFDGVAPEPKLSMVEDAAEELREGGQDLVVGVGGGSSMDTAKLASVLAEHDVPIRDTVGMGNVPGEGRPVALLPTTAGTGSEATHIGVFADAEDGGNKKVVYSEHLFADLALVDPELTRTMPKGVAAATGLDALTHAVESYVTVLRNPVADMYARRAIELIGDNLRPAVHQGKRNDEARYDMSVAATLAGLAFINSGLGAVHALTYPLGVEHHIGHGRANAMLLPHVMAYNVPADVERFAEIGDFLGVEAEGSTRERADASVEAVTELVEDVGISTSLSTVGDFDRSDFERFADVCFEYSEHNIERNPRDLDREDVVRIYERAQ